MDGVKAAIFPAASCAAVIPVPPPRVISTSASRSIVPATWALRKPTLKSALTAPLTARPAWMLLRSSRKSGVVSRSNLKPRSAENSDNTLKVALVSNDMPSVPAFSPRSILNVLVRFAPYANSNFSSGYPPVLKSTERTTPATTGMFRLPRPSRASARIDCAPDLKPSLLTA